MRVLLSALLLTSSISAFASNVCIEFLLKHPTVIFSDFELGGEAYRYIVSHTRMSQECEVDKEFNMATIKSNSAVTIEVQKLQGNRYQPVTKLNLTKIKVNLNTFTAYYPITSKEVPSLVTARKTNSNRLMTTYKLGEQKITFESDYLR